MPLPDYEITTAPDAGFLRITASGAFGIRPTKHLFDRVAADAKHYGANRVLVDATGIVGYVRTMAHYELGAYAASRIKVKAALVGRQNVIDRFGETVAINRGANARVFLHEAEAMAWLLSDKSARNG